MRDYSAMIKIYVRLIQMGKRTIDDVPECIRDDVKKALEG